MGDFPEADFWTAVTSDRSGSGKKHVMVML
jgi:hypothetical protein